MALRKNCVAVISSGNGGQSLAAYYALHGYEVRLYARQQERVAMFPSLTFQLRGAEEGAARLALISCDMRQVLQDAALVMVTTPAQYHAATARVMAPWLQDGQIVVLNPGRTFGVLEFGAVLRESGCHAQIILAETDTFVFTCRCEHPGFPIIYQIKDNLKVAALSPTDTAAAVAQLCQLLPCACPASGILETGLSNIGMLFHPVPALMNLARIETKERFLHYREGISPTVAALLERMDAERVNLARAAGVPVLPVLDWLREKYGTQEDSLYQALQNTAAYADVYAPSDPHTRYIYEDIPTGCVPMAALGRILKVPMPVTESVIAWASTVCNVDFYALGRNEKRLDFSSLLRGPATVGMSAN